jgi:hypothetical protein
MDSHLQDLLTKCRAAYDAGSIQESCEFIAEAVDYCKQNGLVTPNEFRIVSAQIMLHDSLEVMKEAGEDDEFPPAK